MCFNFLSIMTLFNVDKFFLSDTVTCNSLIRHGHSCHNCFDIKLMKEKALRKHSLHEKTACHEIQLQTMKDYNKCSNQTFFKNFLRTLFV